MIWIWVLLLVAGLLLMYTALRVMRGGLTAGPDATSTGRSEQTASGGQGRPSTDARARQILDERYASGELSTQEYEHRRGVLAGREEES